VAYDNGNRFEINTPAIIWSIFLLNLIETTNCGKEMEGELLVLKGVRWMLQESYSVSHPNQLTGSLTPQQIDNSSV
jgi:hypothetical protein